MGGHGRLYSKIRDRTERHRYGVFYRERLNPVYVMGTDNRKQATDLKKVYNRGAKKEKRRKRAPRKWYFVYDYLEKREVVA